MGLCERQRWKQRQPTCQFWKLEPWRLGPWKFGPWQFGLWRFGSWRCKWRNYSPYQQRLHADLHSGRRSENEEDAHRPWHPRRAGLRHFLPFRRHCYPFGIFHRRSLVPRCFPDLCVYSLRRCIWPRHLHREQLETSKQNTSVSGLTF